MVPFGSCTELHDINEPETFQTRHARAGGHPFLAYRDIKWIPACAGMTCRYATINIFLVPMVPVGMPALTLRVNKITLHPILS